MAVRIQRTPPSEHNCQVSRTVLLSGPTADLHACYASTCGNHCVAATALGGFGEAAEFAGVPYKA